MLITFQHPNFQRWILDQNRYRPLCATDSPPLTFYNKPNSSSVSPKTFSTSCRKNGSSCEFETQKRLAEKKWNKSSPSNLSTSSCSGASLKWDSVFWVNSLDKNCIQSRLSAPFVLVPHELGLNCKLTHQRSDLIYTLSNFAPLKFSNITDALQFTIKPADGARIVIIRAECLSIQVWLF